MRCPIPGFEMVVGGARKAAGTAHHSSCWLDHLGIERLTGQRRTPPSKQEIDQQFFEFAELALQRCLVLLLDNQMAC